MATITLGTRDMYSQPIGFFKIFFTYVKLFYDSRNIYHVTAALPSSLSHLFYHKKTFEYFKVDAL